MKIAQRSQNRPSLGFLRPFSGNGLVCSSLRPPQQQLSLRTAHSKVFFRVPHGQFSRADLPSDRRMEATIQEPKAYPRSESTQTRRYTGEVVYVYAYDVAYELKREPVDQLLGQKPVAFEFDSSRRHPRHHFFYKPQMIRLPPTERVGPYGPVNLERVIKLLPVGAVSITVRVPFAVDRIEDLVSFHDLHFDTGSLNYDVRLLAEAVRRELEPHCVRPVPHLVDEEAYTVFCLDAPL